MTATPQRLYVFIASDTGRYRRLPDAIISPTRNYYCPVCRGTSATHLKIVWWSPKYRDGDASLCVAKKVQTNTRQCWESHIL